MDRGRRGRRGQGRGLRISNDLAKGLGGRVEHGFGTDFTSVVLSFPLTEREWQANWTIAKRRIAGRLAGEKSGHPMPRR